MAPFTSLTGVAAALPMANLDTDQIMPKQFLRGVDRESGLGRGFLHDLRFTPTGEPRPDFVLNRAPWTGASILVAGPNFGCGSSREHAVWGLRQLGLRCVIASSFGGIFADNCARNGVPAIVLPQPEVERLWQLAGDPQACTMTVDLPRQVIETPADGQSIGFDFDELRKHMLLKGLDAVGLTMESAPHIRSFEQGYLRDHPWVA
jgi:3-isopropylmalate/(R)-2-methylmalate dehydratase small subunit